MPQLTMEELAPGLPRSFSPEDALNEQIQDLERWVDSNLANERRAVLRFWLLRVPAVLCALIATATGTLGIGPALAGLAAAVALLVAIDSAWPGGTLRSPLRRALYDLRQLQNTVKIRWDRVRLAHPDVASPKRVAYALALLDVIQAKRESISKYLAGIVPSPSMGKRPF
jgi:hypothetical protein